MTQVACDVTVGKFIFGANVRVHEFLDCHTEQSPESEFAVCLTERVTYRDAQNQSDLIARAFVAGGARLGDRISILQKNSIETTLLFLGASKAGVVAMPLNYRLLPSDWLKICSETQPKWLFCDKEFVPAVEEIKSQLTCVKSLVTTYEQPLPGWVNFREWVYTQSSKPPSMVFGEGTDALLLHTSGTTGPPRGAVITHRALTAAIAQLRAVAALRPDDRLLLVLPLCHAAGIVTMLHAISCGACLVIHRDFDPASFINTLDEEDVTVTMMVPTMIRKCLDEVPNLADRSFAKLRLLIYGASPIQQNMMREMMDVFGCDLAQRYGTTETLSLTWLSPADHRLALGNQPELLRSAGQPLPGVEIQTVDGNGESVGSGNRGEIIVRGPQLMRGYWQSSEPVDDNRLPNDWMRTGDVGSIDSKGYLYICARMNDVIISGGENIHPSDIEAVLLEHPYVDDVAVIGIPDPRWGERVKAFVVSGSGANCSAERLIEFCRGQLAGFKVPGTVDFVQSLPRNQAGKLQRSKLREPYWLGQDRSI